jgi:hypothetical protein
MFEQIEITTQTMAPSMIEYYLSNLASNSEEESAYINKSEVQNIIYLDEYMLFIDYSDNIYLEFTEKNDDYDTESLW